MDETTAPHVDAAPAPEPPKRKRRPRTNSSDPALDRLTDDVLDVEEVVEDLRESQARITSKVDALAGEVRGQGMLIGKLIEQHERASEAREKSMRLVLTTLGAVIIVAFTVIAGLAGVGMQVKALGQEVMVSDGRRSPRPTSSLAVPGAEAP